MTLPISNIAPITVPALGTLPGVASQPGEFQKVLQGTIGTLESLHSDASNSVQKFLSGQNEELHTTALAIERSEMAFDLGLQVRNKVVSAYQEIMRMAL
jgi:flagellar hook-basal body complex protein FliE